MRLLYAQSEGGHTETIKCVHARRSLRAKATGSRLEEVTMQLEHREQLREKTTQPPTIRSSLSTFDCQEWVALLMLRRRYRDGQDLWSDRELAHLRFIRWLRRTGRIE